MHLVIPISKPKPETLNLNPKLAKLLLKTPYPRQQTLSRSALERRAAQLQSVGCAGRRGTKGSGK